MIVTEHRGYYKICDKCGSTYVGKECDVCRKYKDQIDDAIEQIRNLKPQLHWIDPEVDAAKYYNGYKYDPKKASDLVDAATYGYRYVQNQGSAFHKAFELSRTWAYDCTGRISFNNKPEILTKKLHIPEYKGEMNMKNVVFEEKQTLRICRETNEWRDIYTVADTEPTDLFALCGDQNMRVYMRVAMDEDTFLVKDPNMRPVLDVETGCVEMLDKDEKIFIYDPRGCNLDVNSFMVKKKPDRY